MNYPVTSIGIQPGYSPTLWQDNDVDNADFQNFKFPQFQNTVITQNNHQNKTTWEKFKNAFDTNDFYASSASLLMTALAFKLTKHRYGLVPKLENKLYKNNEEYKKRIDEIRSVVDGKLDLAEFKEKAKEQFAQQQSNPAIRRFLEDSINTLEENNPSKSHFQNLITHLEAEAERKGFLQDPLFAEALKGFKQIESFDKGIQSIDLYLSKFINSLVALLGGYSLVSFILNKLHPKPDNIEISQNKLLKRLEESTAGSALNMLEDLGFTFLAGHTAAVWAKNKSIGKFAGRSAILASALGGFLFSKTFQAFSRYLLREITSAMPKSWQDSIFGISIGSAINASILAILLAFKAHSLELWKFARAQKNVGLRPFGNTAIYIPNYLIAYNFARNLQPNHPDVQNLQRKHDDIVSSSFSNAHPYEVMDKTLDYMKDFHHTVRGFPAWLRSVFRFGDYVTNSSAGLDCPNSRKAYIANPETFNKASSVLGLAMKDLAVKTGMSTLIFGLGFFPLYYVGSLLTNGLKYISGKDKEQKEQEQNNQQIFNIQMPQINSI